MVDKEDRFSKYEEQLKDVCKKEFGFTWDEDNSVKDPAHALTLTVGLRDIQRHSESLFLTQWLIEVGAGGSNHWKLHEYIHRDWRIHTQQMNCHALTMFAEQFAMSFQDILELVNKHDYFYLTEEEVAKKEKEQEEQLKVLLNEEKKTIGGFGYRFRKRFNEWARNNWYFRLKGIREMPPTVLRTENDIWADYTLESIEKGTHHLQRPHLSEYNTLKFNELQKTLHPKTAPALKEILIEDYLELQKELGFPFEDENSTSGHKPNQGVIRKQLEVGGIAHIWHSYGLLASQWLQKTEMDWTVEKIEEVGYLNSAEEKETEEYFIFLSSLKRLMANHLGDETKIFTLLIHLYQEFSNDKNWKDRWEIYCGLEEEYADKKFHAGLFAQRVMTQEFPLPTIFGNVAWNYERLDYLEEYKEKSDKTFLGFDQYIRDKHFHID